MIANSQEQQEVYTALKETNYHLAIQAGPGSGKTTTLLEALNHIPKLKKAVFLSFSNAIVNVLKERVPVHVKASTLHSLGCRMILSQFRTISMERTGDKYFKAALESYGDRKRDKELWKDCYRVQDICNLARMTLTPFQPEALQQLCFYYNIDFDKSVIAKSIELLKELTILKNQRFIDFTDMIYFPATMPELINEKYHYVFLDEAQDTNKAQLAMVDNILIPNVGRLISCGDKNQTIYGFTGNDPQSFDRIQQRPNTKTLYLKTTYRCCKAVVGLAQTIYPDEIKMWDQAPEGEVVKSTINDIVPGDMVLCRNTAPLIDAFFHFLGRDIKSYVVGKDLEKGLVVLAEAAMQNSFNDSSRIKENLNKKLQALSAELKTQKGMTDVTKHPSYRALQEKVNIVSFILDRITSANGLVAKIHEIFKEDKEAVILISIHRSKGLENERVAFIETYGGDKLCPSKYAEQGWELLQEKNLLFVAYTRAKSKFMFIDF